MNKKNNSFIYFLVFALSFMVGLSLAFSSFNIKEVNASTISYELNVTENSNTFDVGGISNIENLSFDYTFVYKFTYTTTSNEVVFRFLGSSTSQSTYTGNLFWFNHSNEIVSNDTPNLYNVAIRVKDGSNGKISLGPNVSGGSTTRKIQLSAGVYDVFFTTGAIFGNYETFKIYPHYLRLSSTGPTIYFGRGRSVNLKRIDYFSPNPLSYLVDNNELTDYSFYLDRLVENVNSDFGIVDEDTIIYGDLAFDVKPFSKFYSNGNNINFTSSSYGTISAGFLYNGTTSSTSSLTTWYNITYCNFNYSQILNYSFNIVSDSMYFNIHKPTYRFNSSLTFLNYDYLQVLNSVSGVNYTLSRNNDIYSMSYDGPLPNYRNIIFYNNDVKNIMFDEYIDLRIFFGSPINTNVIDLYDIHLFNFNFGFDFNFDQYLNSLVIGDGAFVDFNTYKPQYVAMKFSLSPLYLPILEIVQNAFIFIIFDFPIFNELFVILGFNNLFNLLISIINFLSLFLDFGTINFLTGIISFFVVFNIIKTLVPVAYSSATGVYNGFTSSSAYNDFKADNIKYKHKKKAIKKVKSYNRNYLNVNGKYMYNKKSNLRKVRQFSKGRQAARSNYSKK